jgi:hypothetical protein
MYLYFNFILSLLEFQLDIFLFCRLMLTSAGKRELEANLFLGLFGQSESFPPVQKANIGVKTAESHKLGPTRTSSFTPALLQLTDQAL